MKQLYKIFLLLILIILMVGCKETNTIYSNEITSTENNIQSYTNESTNETGADRYSFQNNVNATLNIVKPLTQKEKIEDFEFMFKILEENYPFFDVNKRLYGIDWLSKKGTYLDMVKTTNSDEEFCNILNNILKDLNNGHTQIINERYYFMIKSLFETEADWAKPWLNQLNNSKTIRRYSDEHVEINGNISENDSDKSNSFSDNVRTKILIQGTAAYLGIKSLNEFNIEGDIKIIKPFLLSIRNYNKLIIDIRGNGGGSTRYWSENIVPMLITTPAFEKRYYVYRGGGFEEPFVESALGNGFKGLKSVKDITSEGLSKLPPEINRDFKYYYTVNNTIYPKESIGFSGKIYLLIDKQVYSSAESFAIFAKSTKFATLVGEVTGGDGIGHDPVVCALPNSGYVFRFPIVMGLTSEGICNDEYKTEPDIYISAKSNINLAKDKAIQYILKLKVK
jgi:hypothetical protein